VNDNRQPPNYIVSIGDSGGATYYGPFSSPQQLLAYGCAANWGTRDWRAIYLDDPRAPLPVITPANLVETLPAVLSSDRRSPAI
jgi:hypothetical protein